jgi:hypothetical protein
MTVQAKRWIAPNLVIATTLLLAACGGGGGGGDSGILAPSGAIEDARPLVALDADNVNEASADAVESVAGFSDASIDDFTYLSAGNSSGAEPTDLTRRLIDFYFEKTDHETLTLAGATQTELCDLGIGSVTLTQEGNEALLTFNECRLDDVSEYLILNGTLYASASESGTECGYTGSGVIVFSGLSAASFQFDGTPIETLGLDGRFNFGLTGEAPCLDQDFRLFGPGWKLTLGSESLGYYDFDITASTNGTICSVDYQATIDVSTLPGSFTVSTPTTVSGDCFAQYPNTGSVRVDGASDTYAQVTINSSGFDDLNALTVTADLDGDGLEDSPTYPVNVSWQQFEALTF